MPHGQMVPRRRLETSNPRFRKPLLYPPELRGSLGRFCFDALADIRRNFKSLGRRTNRLADWRRATTRGANACAGSGPRPAVAGADRRSPDGRNHPVQSRRTRTASNSRSGFEVSGHGGGKPPRSGSRLFGAGLPVGYPEVGRGTNDHGNGSVFRGLFWSRGREAKRDPPIAGQRVGNNHTLACTASCGFRVPVSHRR